MVNTSETPETPAPTLLVASPRPMTDTEAALRTLFPDEQSQRGLDLIYAELRRVAEAADRHAREEFLTATEIGQSVQRAISARTDRRLV